MPCPLSTYPGEAELPFLAQKYIFNLIMVLCLVNTAYFFKETDSNKTNPHYRAERRHTYVLVFSSIFQLCLLGKSRPSSTILPCCPGKSTLGLYCHLVTEESALAHRTHLGIGKPTDAAFLSA